MTFLESTKLAGFPQRWANPRAEDEQWPEDNARLPEHRREPLSERRDSAAFRRVSNEQGGGHVQTDVTRLVRRVQEHLCWPG
jgi:hypothetical protein